jgi:hypothetical protein
MTDDTQTMTDKWLGDNSPFNERFPECGLNEKQVATLLSFSHQIRCSGLGPSPAIHKLTESGIVELSVKWSKHMNDFGSGGRLWMTDSGEYIAGAIWEGVKSDATGPIKVYRWAPMPPGQHFRRFDEKATEVTYPRSDGHNGSTYGTREFIKLHWMGAAT